MLPEWLLWTMTIFLMALGILGTLLPFLPGVFLVVLAAFIHIFPALNPHPISYFDFGIIFFLFVLTLGVDFFFGFIGAKVGGVTRAGLVMGIFGMIFGLFLGPWGIILGPLVGVFIGEYILSNKTTPGALRATAGYVVGNVAGMILKMILALIMCAYLVYCLLKNPI